MDKDPTDQGDPATRDYMRKYMKYKQKYLALKKLLAGGKINKIKTKKSNQQYIDDNDDEVSFEAGNSFDPTII